MIIKRDFNYSPKGQNRQLHIYLPDDYYNSNSNERYPVMYFFDGHNLFYDSDATYGKCWGLKEFLDRWNKKMIIVGIECGHDGNERISEYLPYPCYGRYMRRFFALGSRTLEWIIWEIKPMIDREYRTYPQRECTGIAGSSMGGLMALYGVIHHNQWFSKAACVSSAIGFCMPSLMKDMKMSYISPDTRVFLSWGTLEAKPDATEEEISDAIEKRLQMTVKEEVNFCEADSLSNSYGDLYEMFYNPDESAYTELEYLRSKLDEDYGSNTTLQGAALEKLVLRLCTLIKGVHGSTEVKTETNQFDCTILCGVHTVYPSVFQYLSPYFIVECKNEKKKPDNTYLNKLESILDTNEAQIGIIFGRLDATKPCFRIAREHYLTNKNSSKQQIIITCCDEDWDYLINKKVNLLRYLDYKIFQVTGNTPNSTYEMFYSDD